MDNAIRELASVAPSTLGDDWLCTRRTRRRSTVCSASSISKVAARVLSKHRLREEDTRQGYSAMINAGINLGEPWDILAAVPEAPKSERRENDTVSKMLAVSNNSEIYRKSVDREWNSNVEGTRTRIHRNSGSEVGAYANVVRAAREDIKKNAPGAARVAEEFLDVTDRAGHDGWSCNFGWKETAWVWAVVRDLVRVPDGQWFLKAMTSPNRVEVTRQCLIDNAIRHLGREWRTYMEEEVVKRSGRASGDLRDRIMAYSSEFVPPSSRHRSGLWSHIFFGIRAGSRKAVLGFLREAPPSEEIERLVEWINIAHDDSMVLKDFEQESSEYGPKRLDRLQKHHGVIKDYSKLSTDCVDVFHAAVYNILVLAEPYSQITYRRKSRDSLKEFSQVIHPSLDDYLWLKLKLLREAPSIERFLPEEYSPRSSSGYHLDVFQEKLNEWKDQGHFDSKAFPGKFIRMLLVSQQFSEAEAFFSELDPTLGVHLGFALHVNGLMQLESPDAVLPFFKRVAEYTSTHFADRPNEAFRYVDALYQTRVPTAKVDSYLTSLVSDIVQRAGPSRYLSFLGSFGEDGKSYPHLASQVADFCINRGAFKDAVEILVTKVQPPGVREALRICEDQLSLHIARLLTLSSVGDLQSYTRVTDTFPLKEWVPKVLDLAEVSNAPADITMNVKILWRFNNFFELLCVNRTEDALLYLERELPANIVSQIYSQGGRTAQFYKDVASHVIAYLGHVIVELENSRSHPEAIRACKNRKKCWENLRNQVNH